MQRTRVKLMLAPPLYFCARPHWDSLGELLFGSSSAPLVFFPVGRCGCNGELRNGSSTCFPELRFSVPPGPDSGGRQKGPLKWKEVPLSQLWSLQIYFLILKAKEENKCSQSWLQTCCVAKDALELFLLLPPPSEHRKHRCVNH